MFSQMIQSFHFICGKVSQARLTMERAKQITTLYALWYHSYE